MSAFAAQFPQFHEFSATAKDCLTLTPTRRLGGANVRFIPRNFLLDERLHPSRVQTYGQSMPNPLGVLDDWNDAHNGYLGRHVFVKPPATHDHHVVAPDDPAVCPETLRAAQVISTFQATDLDTLFLRLVPAADLAWLSGETESRIYSLGEQAVADPRPDNPTRDELALILDVAFHDPRCDHRPVFAAFYEEFLDDLRNPATHAWPNRLRDRLGLYHMSQLRAPLPIRVLLFRYPVRDVPRWTGQADRRPITAPTVLDQRLNEAFCPAPRELDRGHTLNLELNAEEEPAREVLHLFMPMGVEHLFRVGLITQPVPTDLAPARREHLIWLQLLADRNDYAMNTDRDLLAP